MLAYASDMAAPAADPRPSPPRCAPPWSRRDTIALGVIFAVALALRLLHLEEIRANDPYFANPSLDPRFHHEAALQISGGDFFTASVALLASIYPYFLASIYALAGPSIAAAKAAQALLGAVSCALIYALAHRVFSRRVAAVSGAIAASYSVMIFYGGTLTIVNVLLPLTLLLLLCVDRAMRRPGAAIWALAGLLVGATTLGRPTALLYAPLLLPWMLYDLRGSVPLQRRLLLALAFGGGLAVAIVPLTARTVLMNSDWRGGVNFYIGNNPEAIGVFKAPRLVENVRLDHPIEMRRAYEAVAEAKLGRDIGPGEVSSFWMREGLRFVRGEPLAWLRLELRKLGLFFNAYEPWNLRSHSVSKSFSRVLRLPLFTLGVVVPLAFLGAFASRRDWRRLAPLYLMVGTYLIIAMLFFVASRYRLPMVPVLILFAGRGLVFLFDAARARDARTLAAALLALALVAVPVHWPIVPDRLSGAYYNLGNRYKALGAWDLAIESYRESIVRNRRSFSAWNNLALVLEAAGREAEAIEVWQAIHGWATAPNREVYRERAVRHLQQLGAPPPAEALAAP
ncbi:MAG: glycosyltransferase family 39 protein [Myxococcota bacterium]